MNQHTLWQMGQLELIGEVRIGVLHESVRTKKKAFYASLDKIEIRDGGLLRSVSASGADLADMIDEVFGMVTKGPEAPILFRWRDDAEFTWDEALGSWRRIDLAFVHPA